MSRKKTQNSSLCQTCKHFRTFDQRPKQHARHFCVAKGSVSNPEPKASDNSIWPFKIMTKTSITECTMHEKDDV